VRNVNSLNSRVSAEAEKRTSTDAKNSDSSTNPKSGRSLLTEFNFSFYSLMFFILKHSVWSLPIFKFRPCDCSQVLGAGKTAAESHSHLRTWQKVAVIVNEFGDVGIDHQLSMRDEEIFEMNNGICCTLIRDHWQLDETSLII